MTEQDYVNVRNIANLRAISHLLRDLMGGVIVDVKKRNEMIKTIDEWANELATTKIKITAG